MKKSDLFYDRVAFLTLFFITLAVYYRSLSGSFIFDDVIVILQEPLLKKENFFDFIKALPFKERPIRLLTFYIDRLIWGLNPFGFRFTNLLIHIANGFLLYALLKRLNVKKEVAFLGAAIFLWHFANPATVCYITGRKDLLGLFFSLSAFFFLFKDREGRKGILLFFLFYLLAFFTKEMFITLPLIAFAYMFIVEDKRLPIKYVMPSLIGIAILTIFVIKFRDVNMGNLYRRLSVPEYFVGYLRLFFDPTFPKVDYVGYFSEPNTLEEVNWLIFGLSFFGVLAFFAFSIFIKRWDRFLSFLCIGFFISLLPILQIIQHSESFAEHYFYFPSLFLSVFLAMLIFKIKKKGVATLLSRLLLALLLPYTYTRTAIFMTEESFWLTAYQKNPKSFRAMQYYGQRLLSENRIDEATKLFEKGFKETERLYDHSDLAYTYYYDFLNDLALASMAKGDFKKAEVYYLKGLKTLPESDKRGLFLFNLSIVYLRQDREKAKGFMKEIVLKRPDYREIAYLLYDVYWQDGQMDKLEGFIDELLRKEPKNYFALSKKILFLLKRGEKERATSLYGVLKRLSPANYYELNDGAEIEISFGNYEKARDYLLMALEERPEYGRTRKNLARLENLLKKP